MNNLKKIGLTALAGSLVAVSAVQAGEMSVSGSLGATYKTKSSGTQGKSIGNDKDVAFSGSGELDNGWTFSGSTLLTDGYIVSSSLLSITMGSMGTISTGVDTGGASYKYDEEVPQAYEQVSDAQQTSANIVGNQMDSNMIVYNSPSFDLEGATISFDAEFSPDAEGAGANDGGQAAHTGTFGRGLGLGVTASYDAVKIGVYAQERKRLTTTALAKQDDFQGVAYVKYSMGPVSVGYSQSYHDAGLTGAGTALTSAATVGTSVGIFEGEQMSIAFNVNDNLSISYTKATDTYNPRDNDIADADQETTALQAAYSMGAMSIKAYQMETDNPGYDTDAKDADVTEIAVGLAF
jgi:outer membrane protein OmpU